MKGSEVPLYLTSLHFTWRRKFLLLIHWQFRFGHPISYQTEHMLLLAGMMGRRYVFYNESWSLGLNSPRSESIISDREIFYKNTLTRRARTGIAGTMETSIRSRSCWIRLPVLPPFDTRMAGYVSTIKVSAVNPSDHSTEWLLWLDQNDGFIRTVRKPAPTGEWQHDLAKVARAVKGSNIAAIIDNNGPARYRVYYQDPELHLKECYYDTSVNRWVPGE